MSWKKDMIKTLKEASKQKAIASGLKELCVDLLKSDSEFQLIYLSSRGKYISIRFIGEVSKKTKILIIKEYGIKTWNIIKPK